MLSEVDAKFFSYCFELANRAYKAQEVPVGCIIVYNDKVIGEGFNEVNRSRNPTRHAEFIALKKAESWCIENDEAFVEVMKRSTFYVNLEPCVMCASALYQLRVKRLVFGAKNPRFGGIFSVASNSDYGHDHNIEIISEIEKDRCIALLRTFYDRENPFAPEEKRKIKKK